MPFNTNSESNASHPLQSAVLYLALGVLAVAPFAYGSYPPWVSGLAIGAFCALGVLGILTSAILRRDCFPVPATVKALSYALIAWLGAMVLRDFLADPSQERSPALGIRQLPYAFAFLAAGMLGAQLAVTGRIKHLYWVLSAVGVILAVLAIIQWSGFDVKRWKANDQVRTSGIFISPNRLAVMEALCISAALALFLASFKEPEVSRPEELRRRLRQIVLGAALASMGMAMVLTLSRLTIVSFGVGLFVPAIFWMRHRIKVERSEGSWGGSRVEMLQRWAFMLMPLVVILGWGALALAFGADTLTRRIGELGTAESGERFEAYKAALPMFEPAEAKLYGYGLGNFEFAFNRIQPLELSGRWNRLHSDWMQLALEAGILATVLALFLTFFWFRAWLINARQMEARRSNRPALSEQNLVLQLVPLSGIITVLICTGGDFPLRETSLALAFFFLAGALAGSVERTGKFVPPGLGALGWVLVPVLLGAFGWSAFIAARNGAAYALSPLRGQYLLPVDPGKDPAPWERAVKIDPGDPQLHLYLADAAVNAADAPQEVYADALAHAKIGQALSPRDCSLSWMAALLSEKAGDIGDVAPYYERAAALYPANLPLRLNAGAFFLRKARLMPPLSSFRSAALTESFTHLSYVVQKAPGYEAEIVKWLEEADGTPEEIVQLWPGGTPAARLSRARFFFRKQLLDDAEKELAPLTLAEVKASNKAGIWYHALNGALKFRQNADQEGVALWGEALRLGASRVEDGPTQFMADEVRNVGVGGALLAATQLVDRMKDSPNLVYALGEKLHSSGKNLEASILLEKTAGNTDYLCQLWAETALAIDDFATAEAQAARAVNHQANGRNWTEWRKKFNLRLAERKRARQK